MIDMVHQKVDCLAALDYLLNRDFEDIESTVIDRSCLVFPFTMTSVHTQINVADSLYHTSSRKYINLSTKRAFS